MDSHVNEFTLVTSFQSIFNCTGKLTPANVKIFVNNTGFKRAVINFQDFRDQSVNVGVYTLMNSELAVLKFLRKLGDRNPTTISCFPQDHLRVHRQIKGFIGNIGEVNKKYFPRYLLGRHRMLDSTNHEELEYINEFNRPVGEPSIEFLPDNSEDDIAPHIGSLLIPERMNRVVREAYYYGEIGDPILNEFWKSDNVKTFDTINSIDIKWLLVASARSTPLQAQNLYPCLEYPFDMPRWFTPRNMETEKCIRHPAMDTCIYKSTFYPGPSVEMFRSETAVNLMTYRRKVKDNSIPGTIPVNEHVSAEFIWTVVLRSKLDLSRTDEYWGVVLPKRILQHHLSPCAFSTVAVVVSDNKWDRYVFCVVMLCETRTSAILGCKSIVTRWLRVVEVAPERKNPIPGYVFWGLAVSQYNFPIFDAGSREIVSKMTCLNIVAKVPEYLRNFRPNGRVSAWADNYGHRSLIAETDSRRRRFDFVPAKTVIFLHPASLSRDISQTTTVELRTLEPNIVGMYSLTIVFQNAVDCSTFIRSFQCLDLPNILQRLPERNLEDKKLEGIYREQLHQTNRQIMPAAIPRIDDNVRMYLIDTWERNNAIWPACFLNNECASEAYFAANDAAIRNFIYILRIRRLPTVGFFLFEVPFNEPHDLMKGKYLNTSFDLEFRQMYPVELPNYYATQFLGASSPEWSLWASVLSECVLNLVELVWIYQVEYISSGLEMKLGLSPILVYFPVISQSEQMDVITFASKGMKFNFLTKSWELGNFFIATCERTTKSSKHIWWLRVIMPEKNPMSVDWAVKVISMGQKTNYAQPKPLIRKKLTSSSREPYYRK